MGTDVGLTPLEEGFCREGGGGTAGPWPAMASGGGEAIEEDEAPHCLRHRPARRLLSMDVADEAVPGEELLVDLRAIGRVGPHRAGRVGLINESLAQSRALVSRRVGCVPAPDQPVFVVDRDVVLVAERRDGDVDDGLRAVGALLGLAELDRPARVAILVGELGGLGLPVLRDAPLPDGRLLILGVALFGRGDQGGSTICPPIAM
jgi:hypothetical protein